jgi:hypothetical protein
MTTPLTKPVFRRTVIPHRGRRLVVDFESGDLVSLRPERTRRAEYVPLAAVYDLAVKMRVARERAERDAKRKQKRSK